MTVSELREFLKTLPDDYELLGITKNRLLEPCFKIVEKRLKETFGDTAALITLNIKDRMTYLVEIKAILFVPNNPDDEYDRSGFKREKEIQQKNNQSHWLRKLYDGILK